MFGLFKKSSITTRILLATLIPMLAVLILSSFFIYKVIRDGSEKYARETTRYFAEQLSFRISDRFSRMNSVVLFTKGGLESLDTGNLTATDTAERLLKSMLLTVPGVYNVWFVFEPGTFSSHPEYANKRFKKSYVITDDGHISQVYDISDEVLDDPGQSPWFAVPFKEDKLFVENAAPHDYRDGKGIVMISSLNYPLHLNGKTVGVLGMDLVFTKILEFVDTAEVVGGNGTISLMNRDGMLIYSTDMGKLDGATSIMASASQRNEAMNSDFALVYDGVDPETGEAKVFCLSKVSIHDAAEPILLYIELPGDILTRQALSLLRTILIIGILGVSAIVICNIVAARTIVRPLRGITKKAREIAAGNLDIQFEETGDLNKKNEVNQLSSALKEMLAQLHQMTDLKIAGMTAEVERQKMREAARMKDRFFASMSHEIRTPMNAVIGLSDLLLTSDLGDNQKSRVEDIRTSAQALLSLINDILDTSKMEAGKMDLNREDYNFPQLIDNISSIIKMMADKKGLTFSMETFGELPVCLYGDEDRVRQILLNLLGNAIKYTRDGFVRFKVFAREASIEFEVADSGIGVKKEILPYIFDIFNRVEDDSTKKIEGTGLGLSIVRMLVEMMGGSISVESIYGQGSSFRVVLPKVLGDPGNMAAAGSAGQTVYNWKARVLVVDDNEINLTVAGSLLEHFGISCDEAPSGEAAIRLASQTEYDLIFMDHIMPGLDGTQTTELLRKTGVHNKRVPIVALTANIQPEARAGFFAAGMNDVLAKPIDIKMMQAVLYKWLPDSSRIELL